MIISIIVAMDESRGIGINNLIPWRLSDDLKRFKSLTMGHHIIMGRLTFKSIGKLLPGRTTIVISRNSKYIVKNGIVVSSLNRAIQIAEESGECEAFIIGGGQIFKQALEVANRIYLTRVHVNLDCDVFFPELNSSDWHETTVTGKDADESNQYPSTFAVLERTLT